MVIHSVTKYLGGHDDLMAGVIVGSAGCIDRARSLATRWGLTATPFDSWLAVRGLHTLQVMKVSILFSCLFQ
jgi:cystathionine beta-lyase/cystathionine gamma-synthase